MCVTVSLGLFTKCFFFFFKQKTAYEVRISDWSSDVCSSDLARIGSGHDGQNAGCGLGVARVYRADTPGGNSRADDPAIGRIGRSVVLLIGIRCEIGSESLRERVVRYV